MNKGISKNKYRLIVIGASSGGMEAIRIILSALPKDFRAPIIIAQHVGPHSDSYMVKFFDGICKMVVKEADEKEKAEPGNVYVAPPNYHLLVEKDGTLSLTVDKKVNYARPSIDVLFESAADAFRDNLIGVVLTGANRDGSLGLKKIKELGGIAIVQEPKTALADSMPRAAISIVKNVDYILPLENICRKLIELVGEEK